MELVYEIAAYLAICVLASGVSVIIGIKYRLGIVVRIVACVIATVILMNVYFQTPLPKGRTGEFYEVFWIVPPLITAVITLWMSRTRRTKQGNVHG